MPAVRRGHNIEVSIRAVVLDFDGVIADTEHLHFAAFRDVFAARGWTLDEATYFDRYLGCDDHGLVRDFARDNGLPLTDADRHRLVRDKGGLFGRQLASGGVLFPGARFTIETLSKRFRLGIASGALHHEIVTVLTADGLLPLFAAVVAADDVTACKPAPDPYLAAAAELGVEPAACVAIEDSVPGLEAARAAGMRTIAITSTSPAEALHAADRIVSSLQEISPDLVAGLWRPVAV
jgi:beta-phosphoglucomutase-like phosphatase (HAD superfamily)